jgi:hypothetical protein
MLFFIGTAPLASVGGSASLAVSDLIGGDLFGLKPGICDVASRWDGTGRI